jgi:hypothetical protein
MWLFNSSPLIGGMTHSKKLSGHRRRARCRTLAVELMESRVPLSASALLLTADTTEPMEDSGVIAADQAMIAPDSGNELTVGSLDAEPDMFCEPVTPSTPEGEADPAEQDTDTQSVEAVMQMGPTAWEPLDTAADDSAELLDMESPSEPTLSDSDEPTSVDVITEDASTDDQALAAPTAGAPGPSAPGPSAPGPSTPGPLDPIIADPITVDTPRIVDFFGTAQYYNIWNFEGVVEYANPQTLTIVFGGLLEGKTTHVRDDGIFQFTWEFPYGTSGLVTVKAVTPDGIESNLASWLIS